MRNPSQNIDRLCELLNTQLEKPIQQGSELTTRVKDFCTDHSSKFSETDIYHYTMEIYLTNHLFKRDGTVNHDSIMHLKSYLESLNTKHLIESMLACGHYPTHDLSTEHGAKNLWIIYQKICEQKLKAQMETQASSAAALNSLLEGDFIKRYCELNDIQFDSAGLEKLIQSSHTTPEILVAFIHTDQFHLTYTGDQNGFLPLILQNLTSQPDISEESLQFIKNYLTLLSPEERLMSICQTITSPNIHEIFHDLFKDSVDETYTINEQQHNYRSRCIDNGCDEHIISLMHHFPHIPSNAINRAYGNRKLALLHYAVNRKTLHTGIIKSLLLQGANPAIQAANLSEKRYHKANATPLGLLAHINIENIDTHQSLIDALILLIGDNKEDAHEKFPDFDYCMTVLLNKIINCNPLNEKLINLLDSLLNQFNAIFDPDKIQWNTLLENNHAAELLNILGKKFPEMFKTEKQNAEGLIVKNLLFLAISQQNLAAVATLLELQLFNVNDENDNGMNAIHYAASLDIEDRRFYDVLCNYGGSFAECYFYKPSDRTENAALKEFLKEMERNESQNKPKQQEAQAHPVALDNEFLSALTEQIRAEILGELQEEFGKTIKIANENSQLANPRITTLEDQLTNLLNRVTTQQQTIEELKAHIKQLEQRSASARPMPPNTEKGDDASSASASACIFSPRRK